MSLIALFVHAKFNNFRYIIIGLNVGLCAFGFPDLFTTFFSDSISNWVQTIVESDGETGVVGSGIGRVELSICKETEKPKEENIKAMEKFSGKNMNKVNLISKSIKITDMINH